MEDNVVILITGSSATGKSTSLRNLDKASTAILNCENKTLPFKDRKFILNGRVTDIASMYAGLAAVEDDDRIKTVVIDSISMFASDIVYAEIVNHTVNDKGQVDTRAGWMAYKEVLMNVIKMCKQGKKDYIITALEDTIVNEQFKKISTASVQGSLGKGNLESHFAIALRAMVLEETDKEGKTSKKHVFSTQNMIPNVDCTAKTPMGMFDDLYIDNDMAEVLNTIKTYYKED